MSHLNFIWRHKALLLFTNKGIDCQMTLPFFHDFLVFSKSPVFTGLHYSNPIVNFTKKLSRNRVGPIRYGNELLPRLFSRSDYTIAA